MWNMSIKDLWDNVYWQTCTSSNCLPIQSVKMRCVNYLRRFVQDQAKQDLKIDRAKTAGQIHRNAALCRAVDILTQDSANANLKIGIIWQKYVKRDKAREVKRNGVTAFRKMKDNSKGVFDTPFAGVV